jgi:hypothetical protein
MRRLCIAVLAAVMAPGAGAAQNGPSDRAQIVAAVQKLFDAMASRDLEMAKQVMVPEGRLFSVSEADGAATVRSRSNQEFVDGLARGTQKLLERMWEPDVRVHGPIATLWANYDFHIDGKFSHCGIDAFELVKTPDGWKISGGVYTTERTGCAPSPLGAAK